MKKLSLFVSLLFAFNIVLLANQVYATEEKLPAPDFTLKDISGRDVSLSSFKGKVVLINFWGTFCVPCRKEMPSIETLYKTYKDKGFVVLAVSEDKSISNVKEFIKEYRLTFPVILDDDKKVAKQYKVSVLPVSFLIDKKGMVSRKFFGEREWTDTESKKMVEELLSE
jgi:peroxiredoxin